jgi:hypothetical protein
MATIPCAKGFTLTRNDSDPGAYTVNQGPREIATVRLASKRTPGVTPDVLVAIVADAYRRDPKAFSEAALVQLNTVIEDWIATKAPPPAAETAPAPETSKPA